MSVAVFDILQIKMAFNLKTCVVWVLWIVNIIAYMSLLVTDEMQSYIFDLMVHDSAACS